MQRPEHLDRFDILYDNPVQIIHNQERFNLPQEKCAVFGIDELNNKHIFIDLHEKLNYEDEPFGFSNRLICEKASWIFSEIFNFPAGAHVLDAFDLRDCTNTSFISNEQLIYAARDGKADWFLNYLRSTNKIESDEIVKILNENESFGNLKNSFPILAFYNNQYFKRKNFDMSFWALCVGFIGEKINPIIIKKNKVEYSFGEIGNEIDKNKLSILTITKSTIQKKTAHYFEEPSTNNYGNVKRTDYRFNRNCEYLNQSTFFAVDSFNSSLYWFFKNLIDGYKLKINPVQFIATSPHFYNIDRTEKSLEIRPKRRLRLENVYNEAREYSQQQERELSYADFIFFLINRDHTFQFDGFKSEKSNHVQLLKTSLKLKESTDLLINETSDIQNILSGQINMREFLENQIESMYRNGYM